MDHIETRAYKRSPINFEINHSVGVVRPFHREYGYVGEQGLRPAEQRLIRMLATQAFTMRCERCNEISAQPFCYQCQCEAHAIGEYDMDGEGFRI